jgi:hypothetical protein
MPRNSQSPPSAVETTYRRNEIERFERYVTDWGYCEYAYHLSGSVPMRVARVRRPR